MNDSNGTLVYKYNIIWNKIQTCYESLKFRMYESGKEKYLLDILPKTAFDEKFNEFPLTMHSYYDIRYESNLPNKFGKLITRRMLPSSQPFIEPLDYYHCLDLTPKFIKTDYLQLEEGFSIDEESKFAFIYQGFNDTSTAIKAYKYGLKNTGEADYSKFISEYYVTSSGVLVVKNRFLEDYNYIATKRDHSIIMTQDDFYKVESNNSEDLLCCIYMINQPKKITISKRGQKDPIHDIDIKYNHLGLTESVKIDDKECCEYQVFHQSGLYIIKSKHPLLYEPFCRELYKDILIEDLPYIINEDYEFNGSYISYTREVYRIK